MAKIVFWQAGDNDGCSFYRCSEPARVLAERGHDTYSGRIMLPSVWEGADTIVGQRMSEEGPLLVWRELAKQGDHRLVYELDDDLFSVPEHFGSVHTAYADRPRRKRMLQAIDMADVITVTNEHLANRVDSFMTRPGTDIRVVPNYVPERLVVGAVPSAPLSDLWQPARVGWAGSGSHKQDFEQVIIPLRQLLRNQRARVHLIGPDYTPRLRTADTAAEGALVHTPWVEGVDNFVKALDFHIGLAPLLDDQFNRSKSDIKLKEYAARGIAPMAPEVGPYATSLVPRAWVYPSGFRGLEQTWESELAWLLELSEHREHVANEALEWARENTLELHAHEWERALLS